MDCAIILFILHSCILGQFTIKASLDFKMQCELNFSDYRGPLKLNCSFDIINKSYHEEIDGDVQVVPRAASFPGQEACQLLNTVVHGWCGNDQTLVQALYEALLELAEADLLPLSLLPTVVHQYDQVTLENKTDDDDPRHGLD